MTTTLTHADTTPSPSTHAHAVERSPAHGNAPRLTFGRVLRFEWIKARSLRTTFVIAALTIVIVVGFGLLAAYMSTTGGVAEDPNQNGPGGGGFGGDPLSIVLAGGNLAVLLVAVFGALAGSREYTSGMIRTTLAAVPKRLPALWAKVLTSAAVIVPTVVIAIAIAFGGGMALLEDGGAASLSLSDDGVVRALLGQAGYLTAVALIGLALGVLLRSAASSIGLLIAGLLILPGLAGLLLPDSWSESLEYLPSNAGSAVSALTQSDTLLSPTAGALTLVAWVVVALGAAAVSFKRRDA